VNVGKETSVWRGEERRGERRKDVRGEERREDVR
jgi:hypothetical protein